MSAALESFERDYFAVKSCTAVDAGSAPSRTNCKLTDMEMFVFEKGEINCSDVEELLYQYAEQELAQPLRARIDDHIAHCAECEELVESYLLTIDIARSLPQPVVPAAVHNRLRESLNSKLGLSLAPVSVPHAKPSHGVEKIKS